VIEFGVRFGIFELRKQNFVCSLAREAAILTSVTSWEYLILNVETHLLAEETV
jgi:hypothetical protein